MKRTDCSAYIKREDLVLELANGKSQFISGAEFSDWFSKLDQQPLSFKPHKPRLIHLLYEAGAFLLGKKPRPMDYYAVDTEFESVSIAQAVASNFSMQRSFGPRFGDYLKSFEKVQAHLRAGNAYQVNLTSAFDYEVDPASDPLRAHGFMFGSGAGSFAQTAFWPQKSLSFISNSPETLFTARATKSGQWRVCSKPIKGTAVASEAAWSELQASMKDQAELLMITDLVRNDLNRLSGGQANVDALKARLDVPGLVHQYSEVSALVDASTSVGEVIRCLFPGGSITGAPKQRVFDIINEIESEPREFYCGSTLFWDGSGLSCSINIRSGVVNWSDRSARFNAGGGVTVQSEQANEWQELQSKLSSLENALNPKSP
tara:strand:- start:635 stop:1756 length:1122 start_codon:yes stop_codon:yes gene_type:complete